jgi:hypothetical protein
MSKSATAQVPCPNLHLNRGPMPVRRSERPDRRCGGSRAAEGPGQRGLVGLPRVSLRAHSDYGRPGIDNIVRRAMTWDVEVEARNLRGHEVVCPAIFALRSTRIAPRNVATESRLARLTAAPRRSRQPMPNRNTFAS